MKNAPRLAMSLGFVVLAACGHDGGGEGFDLAPDSAMITDAAAGPDDLAFNPRTWTPTGKGLWIWYFSYTGKTAVEVATEAKALGVTYVLIKTGQDANFYSTRYTPENVAAFTSLGIKVFGWPYVTPNNIPGSIDAIEKAALIPGTSGIIIDAEVEFEGNHAAAALALCDGLRQRVPGLWLGYTSFGWVSYHATFPFSTFDQHCGDAFFPQVYWSDRGVTQTKGYQESLANITAAKLAAPVWMIQSNDDTPSGTAPSTTDLNAFFDTAGPLTSLWEQPAAAATAKLTQLSALHWAN